MFSSSGTADELLINFGGGPQVGSDQNNRTAGIDYSFFRHERSMRQAIIVGVSYTYLNSDSVDNSSMYAISIYPQLSFYPEPETWVTSFAPHWAKPFFYVRALAPSYISTNKLGEREQAHHFAFQAQIGVGVMINTRKNAEVIIALSWKHFSNANLFDENDGIDIPFVLNFGIQF